MTYREAVEYLESFINYEKIPAWSYKESLKLTRISDFLNTVNNPQSKLRCIHVAGSKGKGSTCAFIANILKEAGFKTGLYTSPHLNDFRERIRILESPSHQVTKSPKDFEGMITKRDLLKIVNRLKPEIDTFNKKSKYGPLSFFEIYTALSFLYFKERKTDFVVLETGLGGRLDATNIVNPLVCAITPISYEHTDKLGNTLTQIAKEKAGIIKGHQVTKSPSRRTTVISAEQEKEAKDVIRNKCKKVGVNLYEVGKDITYQGSNNKFNIKGILKDHADLRINLLGKHQMQNASIAVAAIEALNSYGIKIDTNAILLGLSNTLWPGRCEVISKKPQIILDGAHNVASARILAQTIRESFQYKRLILVLGISSDKDIPGVCKSLCPLAQKVILTKVNNPRAAEVKFIKEVIVEGRFKKSSDIIETKNLKEAKMRAISLAGKSDLILVTGSLFVVGEFKNA